METNLTNFLTGIANAIREKKGTTGSINPQDFATEIRGIQTGGSTSNVTPAVVRFACESIDDETLQIKFYDSNDNVINPCTNNLTFVGTLQVGSDNYDAILITFNPDGTYEVIDIYDTPVQRFTIDKDFAGYTVRVYNGGFTVPTEVVEYTEMYIMKRISQDIL